ncbi:phasin family protein [Leeia sp. TBRC 13508]|uniref:Phasin family protein n=1 Tax=Leeia speluncae TaxID=2884804 RepID=A0ABS8DAU0_9NEIS|nr:phasin family protein [Leeia speluncae]MCB6185326.1 phasin family protein [Leeia speluncae]
MSANETLKQYSLKQAESALQLAQISLGSAEKLIKLQLDTAKALLEEQARQTQLITGIKSVQQANETRQSLTESNLDNLVSLSRSVYEYATNTQSELAKFTEARITELNKDVITLLDQSAKMAPAGSEAAVTAVKQTVQATAAAVDSLSKAAKQVADFTEASVKSATTATVDAIKQAATLKV